MATSNQPKVGSAVFTVTPSMEGSRTAIQDALVPDAEKAGNEAGKKAGTGISDGISTVKMAIGNALGNILTSAISKTTEGIKDTFMNAFDNYADYEQLTGGVETLFKDSSATVMKYAKQAYKTAGLSANQYMESVTSFSASLLSGLGGDTAKAAEYANMALTDMSDNANKMGTDMSLIENAYQGFAKQNYTMLDNLKLGYGGTQAEMARLINETGVMGSEFVATAKNINEVPFDKIIEGIHVVQDRMEITGTTAKEAASTISGSIGMMQSAWQNWLTGLADPDADMSELTKNLVEALKTVFQNVKPMIKDMLAGAFEGVTDLLEEAGLGVIADMMSTFGEIVSSNKELWLSVIADMMNSLRDVFTSEDFQLALKLLSETAAFLLKEIAEVLPGIVQALAPIGEALVNIFQAFSSAIYADVFWEMLASIEELLGSIVGTLTSMFGTLIPDWNALFDIFTDVEAAIRDIADVLVVVWGYAVPVLENVGELIGSILETLMSALAKLMPSTGDVTDFLATVFTAINAIVDALKVIWDFISPIIDIIADVAVTVFGALWEILQAIGETIAVIAAEVADSLGPEFEDMANVSFENLGETLKIVVEMVKDLILNGLNWIKENGPMIGDILATVGTVLMAAFTIASTHLKGLADGIKAVSDFLHPLLETAGNVAKGIIDAFSGIGDAIVGFFKGIPDAIAGIFKDIKLPSLHFDGEFDLMAGKLPSISVYGKGGFSHGETLVYGERGTEMMWPAYEPYFSQYAAGIARHLDGGAGGGDTYIIVDGAVVNSSEEMKNSFYDNFMELKRLGVMNSGYAR